MTRISTTHTGSLPRPKDLLGLLQARTRSAVFDAVGKQVDTNIVWLKLRSLVEGARLASAQLG